MCNILGLSMTKYEHSMRSQKLVRVRPYERACARARERATKPGKMIQGDTIFMRYKQIWICDFAFKLDIMVRFKPKILDRN